MATSPIPFRHGFKALADSSLQIDAPIEQPSTQESELSILIWPDDFAEFEGTAAQLHSEGLTPKSGRWPEGCASEKWSANGFNYWLRRTRPKGFKGPMRAWLALDNWTIRVTVKGRDWAWRDRRAVELKAIELAKEINRRSTAGRIESETRWQAYWKAQQDSAFQHFKSLVLPAPKKRGRRPKAGPASAQESA